jgi:hypothetical protein
MNIRAQILKMRVWQVLKTKLKYSLNLSSASLISLAILVSLAILAKFGICAFGELCKFDVILASLATLAMLG